MKKYLRLMRVKHYIKNLLIFVPYFFSGPQFATKEIIYLLLGMCSFSLMASSIYVINDLADVEKDRKHPSKKNRPIASGEISLSSARLVAIACLLVGVGLNIYMNTVKGLICAVIYFVLNLLYSFKLKKVPMLDVVILVSGFVIRVLYGGVISNVIVSSWLFLTVVSAAFFFAFGKRRNELSIFQSGTREALQGYTYEFLDKNMYVCMGLFNVFYALWSIEHSNDKMIWTVPIVLVISMRYSMDIEGKTDGDPTEVLLSDGILILLSLVYVCIISCFIFL